MIFDVSQEPNTQVILFRLGSQSAPEESTLYLLSETRTTQNHLTLRLGKEIFSVDTGLYDGNFHRIHLHLENGKFTITVDCVKIAESAYTSKTLLK